MNQQIATVAYALLIVALFWLDRERQVKVSWALWIPTLWLLINGSRPVSSWLMPGQTISTENLEGSPVDAAVFGTLLVAAIGVLTWRWRRTLRFLRANATVLLFFAYCAASVVWSDYPFVAFKRWTKAIGDVAMVLVALTDISPTAALRRLLSRMAFLLLPLSVLFIKYYPQIGRGYNPWTWLPSYGGVTTFKNLLGMTCLVAGLGSVWQFVVAYRKGKIESRNKKRFSRERWQQMLAHGTMIAMAVWLFLTADSMTSFSCFVFGSGLIVLTSIPRIGRRRLAVPVLMVSILVLASLAVFLPGAGMVESLGRDSTLTGRTAIWAAVISLVRHPLIGTGFESFWTGDRLPTIWKMIQDPGIQEAHNGYLEVYLNLGWIGVSLLALVIATGYRNTLNLFRRNPEAGLIRLAFFLTGLIYSFTEAGFRMMSVVWMAFLFAAIAVPQLRKRVARTIFSGADNASRENVSDRTAPVYEDALETI